MVIAGLLVFLTTAFTIIWLGKRLELRFLSYASGPIALLVLVWLLVKFAKVNQGNDQTGSGPK